jgi:tetratricopeptide (TPR) repeat protein
MAVQMGMVHRARNEPDKAMREFEIAMQERPDLAAGYQAAALVLQDGGKVEAAIEVLERGNRASDGKSADLNYSLGLLYLKAKRLDDAEARARRAYELGYPLPGLKKQLAAAGRPIDVPGASPLSTQ